MKPSSEGSELQRRIESLADRLPAPHTDEVRAAAGRLARFLLILQRANETLNLVSRKAATADELVERHLFDSLLGLAYLPPRGPGRLRLLDIGSGGGFPALPLLIVRGDLDGLLVESVRKKSVFLKGLLRDLETPEEGSSGGVKLTASVLNARFPDSFQMKDLTPIHILTSRAVAGPGRLVASLRGVLRPPAIALFWTTEPLYGEAVREAGVHRSAFHRSPGAESRGIAVLECFT